MPLPSADTAVEPLGSGAGVLRGFVPAPSRPALRDAIELVAADAPFRHWDTRGGGRIGVAMTNCGALGWVSDRTGYRYDERDPLSGEPWPPMPAAFAALAAAAAAQLGFASHRPDCCLINRYRPGDKLSLHVDRDERNAVAPIVSVSLGATATFLWGGLARGDPTRRVVLDDGDVVVWGGPSRFVFHGVARLAGTEERTNLTFRVTGRGSAPSTPPRAVPLEPIL